MIGLTLIVHILTCFMIIALVLLQQGKGAEMGAGFGSGAANTVFGSQGASSFLGRLTLVLALVFFITSLVLNYLTAQHVKSANQRAIPNTPAKAGNAPANGFVPTVPTPARLDRHQSRTIRR